MTQVGITITTTTVNTLEVTIMRTAAIMAEENLREKIQSMNKIIKNNVTEVEEKLEKDHNFFYLDDANQKQQQSIRVKQLRRKVKPHTSRRIKARNFLSNIVYSGVKSEDFVDNNFVFDMITLLTKKH